MSIVKNETIEANRNELHLSIAKEVFDTEVTNVMRKQSKNLTVPGFRKGKAPLSVIRKMYGEQAFYEDAINNLIPGEYEAAVKESGLDIVGRPEFDIVSLDENGLVLSAKVYTKPAVEISDYLGIKVEKDVKPVTDEDVDREIATVRERNGREIEITEAAAMGDTAKIDFDGSVDRVAFEGGKGTDYALKLGSGSFIPGFEEQVAGHAAGEEFDVNVTFPADYHAAELAGKAAVFKCKIHSVTRTELPELDDEFAKEVSSDFDTFDAYKADVRAKLEKRAEDAADGEVTDKLMEEVIGKLKADIPACMIDEETENSVRDYDYRLRQSGLDLKTYFKYTGLTMEALREQMKPQAEKQVKSRLALEKIAELEKIEVTDDEIEKEYTDGAAYYGMTAEDLKKAIDAESIKKDVRVRKAVDLIKAKAVIVAAGEKAKAAPKKKATAKKAADAVAEETPVEEAKPKTTRKCAPKKAAADADAKADAPAEKKAAPKKKAPAKKAADKAE